MATICPNCGSPDTNTGIDRDQCLNCGKHFDANGVAEPGLDQTGRDLAQATADKTHEPNVVGNLADLQRAGAAIHEGTGSTLADGAVSPPGTGGDEVTTAKDTKAKK